MSKPKEGSFAALEREIKREGIAHGIYLYLGFACAALSEERAEAIKTLKYLEEMVRKQREELEAKR